MPFQPNHLSILGIIHTAISILALFAGFYALLTTGKLNPAKAAGKLYLVLTAVTCLTALPIMKTGHPTPGHFLAIIILVLLPVAYYAKSFKFLGKGWEYLQIGLMSTTLFLSMIPTIVETLTRLPISHPIASDPAAPIIKMCQFVLIVVYLGGVAYQFIKLKKSRKTKQSADAVMKVV